MAVTVKLRSLRHSARKLQPVARMFVGKNLEHALNQTLVMPQDSGKYLHKLLKMAESAAKQKEFNPADMIVTQIFASQGPKIKRIRANARGRANAYKKHLAHLTVMLEPAKKAEEKK